MQDRFGTMQRRISLNQEWITRKAIGSREPKTGGPMKHYLTTLLFLSSLYTPCGRLVTEWFLKTLQLRLTYQQICWCRRLESINLPSRKGKKELSRPQKLIRTSLGIFLMGLVKGTLPWGAGAIIFLDETNKISFNIGLGRASNNKDELSTLWATMKIPSDKHIQSFHIYGDSKTVIDWETQRNNIRDPHLKNLLKAIRAL